MNEGTPMTYEPVSFRQKFGKFSERFQPKVIAQMNDYQFKLARVEGEFVWIAVGRLMWKKNYPALLEAFRQCGRGTLLIAGEGPDEAQLRANAPSRTVFLGLRSDLPDLYNAADAFVMTGTVPFIGHSPPSPLPPPFPPC